MSKAVIVIPVYKTEINEYERKSIEHCRKYLNRYDCVIVAPSSMDISAYIKYIDFRVERFPDRCFSGIDSYNRLMLSKEFYMRFINYEYMLIYQLDALVLSDSLNYFLSLGYDYIGAPWPDGVTYTYRRISVGIRRINNFLSNRLFSRIVWVGNGGLSLRKIDSFIKVLDKFSNLAAKWSTNEDIFYAHVGKCYPEEFFVAPISEALKFSFELNPRRCYELNGNKLPFACHAWFKYDKAFWDNHLQ